MAFRTGAKERERTGIKTMKIKYNRVFGYSLEITNTFKDLVPDNYIRKQTLTNAERYITQELKELEDLILGAEDKLYALEYELFCDVRDTVGKEVMRIQKTAKQWLHWMCLLLLPWLRKEIILYVRRQIQLV